MPPGVFGLPGFAGLWGSAAAGSFGRVTTQVTLSWVALEVTGSPFAVGVVLAARMLPQLLLGLPLGVVADYFERRLLIVAVNAISAVTAVAFAGAAAAGLLDLSTLVLAALLLGMLDALRTTATQAYAYDLVRASRATRGIAILNLGVQLFSALGGLIGGQVLARLGGAAAFGLTASAAGVAAGVAAVQTGAQAEPSEPRPRPPESADSGSNLHSPADDRRRRSRTGRREIWRALTLLMRNRLLATLSLAILLTEMLGFASMTLLPTFAREVFDVGAAGLGEMLAARSVGGVLGLLTLARFGTRDRSGAVLLGAGAAFGAALVAFAASPGFGLALGLLALAGLAASTFDSLGQTLMQRVVGERERGAAMGIWVFSIGFAPVGHLALGAAAASFGAPTAQAVSGAALVLVVLLLSLNAPLRRVP